MKRRRRGQRQTGGQSEKLTGEGQTKEWSGPTQQQIETEVQPAEPLRSTPEASSPDSTPPRRHPSRRQRKKKLRQRQKEADGNQKPSTQEMKDAPVDVPAAPAVENLPPRRWEQVNLRKDSVGCSSPGVPPPVPVGCPTADPPSNQPITSQAVTYIGSLFVPGRVAGRNLNFLVDTGCTHNLLSRTVFDRLPAQTRQQMVYGETVAAMADGSGLHIYGSIGLSGRLRNVPFEARFLVCRISDNAILGMEFLSRHDCSVACDKGLLVMGGKTIQCTDRAGRLLANKVQVTRTLTLPPDREVHIKCRLNSEPSGPVGLIEGLLSGESEVVVAATLDRPRAKREVTVRCMNLGTEPRELKAGTIIGIYQPVDEDQIEAAEVQAKSVLPGACSEHVTRCPPHVRPLLEQTRQICETDDQFAKLAGLLIAYQDVFSKGDTDVGRTDVIEHSIPLLDGTRPIRQPPRRLGLEKDQEVERQVADLVQRGMVEPADGAWSSPVVLVRKKDQSWRLCIDYRRLNAVTRKDAYPLPRIDDSLDALAGSMFFSTLDLVSGYWQVPLDKDAQEKSAFVTRGGLWQWRVLPFGLTSAPATFERLMEKVLKGLQWRTLLLYLDDVIIFSKDFESHLERLAEVCQRFRSAQLKLRPEKCHLFQREVHYLGHVVSRHGVATDPAKIAAVRDWKTPQCTQEVKSFLGFVGYYRRFCPDFATIARPLNILSSKEVKFQWGPAEETAFQQLRALLIEAPVLTYPDPSRQYILDTDASNEAAGAVLSQIVEGEERVVAYYSKTFSPPQRNYCVTRRELLAVVMATNHFRPYLYGQEFRLRTDHASLLWLYKRTEPSHQVARWLESLAEFRFQLEHRAGAKHGNADGLSRCADCPQCTRIEDRDGGPTREELATGRPQVTAISLSPTVSDAELEQLQQVEGSPIAIIRQSVMTGVAPDPLLVETSDSELSRLLTLLPHMEVRGGLLKIKSQEESDGKWKVVCPKTLRKPVAWEAHRQGHTGIDRTLRRVQADWFWPGMTADIRRLVSSCEACQAAKHSNPVPNKNRQRLQAGRPWQVLSIDLVGPLTPTPRGNTNILVLSDHFTRWRDALPVQNGSAETIAEILEERVFCYLGVPERIHTDQGAQFESRLMAELCALWGVRKSHTTPYHPQSNGVVERGNRDLGDMLRSMLIGKDEEDWDLLLPQIMRTIRASPHKQTGETAKFLILAREVRLPEHLLYGPAAGETTSRERITPPSWPAAWKRRMIS